MGKKKSQGRITDSMLDELLDGEDPAELFRSGGLVHELKRKLSARILAAERKIHLSQPEAQGTFEPQLVEKYCREIPDFDHRVVRLYAQGFSERYIRDWVKELYAVEVSPEFISKVTDEVLDEYQEWQQWPLQERYAIVYLATIQVPFRAAGAASNRAVCIVIGVAQSGRKEILGFWFGKHKGARFWMVVLND